MCLIPTWPDIVSDNHREVEDETLVMGQLRVGWPSVLPHLFTQCTRTPLSYNCLFLKKIIDIYST